MKQNLLIAYLAGAIDSDGTIGIKKSTYSMRVIGDCNQAIYSERLALRQVQDDIPTLLRDTFGGSLYITKPSTKNGKPLLSWSITDQKAVAALRQLLPFLTVKKNQAKNALALRIVKEKSKKERVKPGRGHAGSSARLPSHSEEMERLYRNAKKLNVVGVI